VNNVEEYFSNQKLYGKHLWPTNEKEATYSNKR
jgi:hypothetical protein